MQNNDCLIKRERKKAIFTVLGITSYAMQNNDCLIKREKKKAIFTVLGITSYAMQNNDCLIKRERKKQYLPFKVLHLMQCKTMTVQ